MTNTKKIVSLQTGLVAGFFVALLVLAGSPALAQYGPPANIPDMSSFPGGMPGGAPNGMPSGIPIPGGIPNGIPGGAPNGMPDGILNGVPGGSNPGMPANIKMGPSEEQMRQIEKQKVTQMRRGLGSFVKQMTRVKNTVADYEKKGVVLPEELKTALNKIDEDIKIINTSDKSEELTGVIDNFSEATDVISDWMPKLPKLLQLPKVMKQAEREIAKADAAYNKDVRQMARSKVDAADVLAQFRTDIDSQKNLLNEVKTLAKTDSEAAFDKLTDEFFGNLDNMWENEKVIQMSLNIKKAMTQMTSEMKLADRTIAGLKKKKVDTAELESLLAQAKVKFEDLKKSVNAKPFDANAVMDGIDSLMEAKQEFADKLEEITGNTEFKPQLSPLPAAPKMPDLQGSLPQGF